MDLAYALQDYDVAIFVDALPRGNAPGTLYLIEPELDDEEVGPDAHGMDPVKVLALAREPRAARCRACWWWAASRPRCSTSRTSSWPS